MIALLLSMIMYGEEKQPALKKKKACKS